jgi:hypothetical protein
MIMKQALLVIALRVPALSRTLRASASVPHSMTHESGQLDSPVVPGKSPNKAGQPVAEGRKLASAHGAPDTEPGWCVQRVGASTGSSGSGQEGTVHGALASRLSTGTSDSGLLRVEANRGARCGGETWQHYGEDLEGRARHSRAIRLVWTYFGVGDHGFW